MLIITRKPGQIITIGPVSAPLSAPVTDGIDLSRPVPYFTDGPIEIRVTRVRHGEVRLGIHAHPGLLVLRGEVQPWEAREPGDRATGSKFDGGRRRQR